MIYDNDDLYFVTGIEFQLEKKEIRLPDYLLAEDDEQKITNAIRSYLFYYAEPNYQHVRIEKQAYESISVKHIEQSFDADDADAINKCMKDESGKLVKLNISYASNYIVPFDYNCIKYADGSKHEEIIQQEIFEHMLWSFPVSIMIY